MRRFGIIDIFAYDQLDPIKNIFTINERNFFRDRCGIIGNMSLREAFEFADEIQSEQVVPLHWDMFAINAVDIEEIRLTYKILKSSFSLLVRPLQLNFDPIKGSLIIRTLNESGHLGELLDSISTQKIDDFKYEIIELIQVQLMEP